MIDDDEDEHDEDYDDDDQEDDPDQVAYVDEEGWFYVDEEVINAVDEHLGFDDQDYAQQVITYTEAHHALARARDSQSQGKIIIRTCLILHIHAIIRTRITRPD